MRALAQRKVRLRLQPQPFKVLSLLVSRAGNSFPREEIRHELWDQDAFVDFEQGSNVCIRQIHTALNDTAAAPCFVETVPRRGCRYIAPATQVPRTVPIDSRLALRASSALVCTFSGSDEST